jgi:hypothetical protein
MPPRQAPTPPPRSPETNREGIAVLLRRDRVLWHFPEADGIEIHDGGALIVMNGRDQLAAFGPHAYEVVARPSVIETMFGDAEPSES